MSTSNTERPRGSLAAAMALGTLTALAACDTEPADDDFAERARRIAIDAHREKLAGDLSPDERATLEHRLARLERGEHALDERESLEVAGYSVTEETLEQQVYRNDVHGYQLSLPAGLELQEHRNGQYVQVPGHGTFFAIWIHADEPVTTAEKTLLASLERWCSASPDCAAERAANGDALRLVPIERGGFTGYKAIPSALSDDAAARFYAFESPRQPGYFGFNLTPDLATMLVDSLEPLTAVPPGR
jgi:hypothetical protein